MTKVTVEAELRAKLNDFQDLVEICDDRGEIVGFFHPVASGSGQTASPISDEEIEACRQQ